VLRTEVVGFVGSLIQPGAYTKDTWRESRTVVLPDMQGLGLGPRLSDAVASLFFQQVKRHTRLVRRRRRRRAHLQTRWHSARACKAHKPAACA
jgi:GNAT superfamily N-acetyltransferase